MKKKKKRREKKIQRKGGDIIGRRSKNVFVNE